jgi:hypothetical protein
LVAEARIGGRGGGAFLAALRYRDAGLRKRAV